MQNEPEHSERQIRFVAPDGEITYLKDLGDLRKEVELTLKPYRAAVAERDFELLVAQFCLIAIRFRDRHQP